MIQFSKQSKGQVTPSGNLGFDRASDESLCSMIRAGDIYAEEVLIKRYGKTVKACCRSYFLVGSDCDDLIQEGMFGLIKAIRTYDGSRGATFCTYARVCITRCIFTAIKNAKSFKHTPLNGYVSIEKPLFDNNTEGIAQLSLPFYDPESFVIGKEQYSEVIQKLADSLSVFEAKVLELYLVGTSYDDIACSLGRPLKSVDNAIQRIRRKAAQLFS